MPLIRASRRLALLAVAQTFLMVLAPMANAREGMRPTVCTEQYAPVCARTGDVLKTYSNACFAHAGGATLVAQGPCPKRSPGVSPE